MNNKQLAKDADTVSSDIISVIADMKDEIERLEQELAFEKECVEKLQEKVDELLDELENK